MPDEKAPLIDLQLNFVGEYNITEKYIFFFAELYDSKIVSFTISGEMYFSIEWGDNPNFILSVGGFHPDFVPPPLRGNVGQLKRLTLNLLKGDNPRLTLTFYFATTSNSVQFGASVDFLAKAGKFRIVGYLYFDALFQFNPFYFKISIGAGLAVMLGSRELFGIHLKGSLEGPTPWRIKGTASFRILFVRIKVRVSKTFGKREDTSLPPFEILPFLQEPLRDPRNWVASRPESRNLLVTTRQLETEDLVAHPYSVIGVNQNRLPLHTDLDKVGSNEPADFNKFRLLLDLGEGGPGSGERMTDFFAPAEYIRLTDDEKLARKSFEKFPSGIKAAGQDNYTGGAEYPTDTPMESEGIRVFGDYVEKTMEHELQLIDDFEAESQNMGKIGEEPYNFIRFVAGNAVALSALGRSMLARNSVLQSRFSNVEERYHIVYKENLTALQKGGRPLEFATETQARNAIRRMIAKKPKLRGAFQVMAVSETNN